MLKFRAMSYRAHGPSGLGFSSVLSFLLWSLLLESELELVSTAFNVTINVLTQQTSEVENDKTEHNMDQLWHIFALT